MHLTIPPPYEPVFTLFSLPLVAALGVAVVLCIGLWGAQSTGTPHTAGSLWLYKPNRFLAVLVAILIVQLALSILITSGYIYYMPLLARLPILPIVYLIGPLIYFYIRTMTSPEPFVYSRWHLLHLVPFMLGLIMNLPFLAMNANTMQMVLYDDIYPLLSTADLHVDGLLDSHAVLTMGGSGVTQTLMIPGYYGVLFIYYLANSVGDLAQAFVLCVYAGCSFHVLRQHKKNLLQLTSAMQGLELKWMWGFLLLAMLAIGLFGLEMLMEVMTAGFNHVGHPLNYAPYYAIVLLIGFIIIKALRQPQIFSPQLRAAWLEIHEGTPVKGNLEPTSQSPTVVQPQPSGKYKNSVLTPALSAEIAREIAAYVETNKPWLNPELTLADLASQTGFSSRVISQTLNETLGQSFFDYINGFRINAVKIQLLGSVDDSAPILNIAMDCGFNSKSAFYSVFKKREGKSPTEWLKQALQGTSDQ